MCDICAQSLGKRVGRAGWGMGVWWVDGWVGGGGQTNHSPHTLPSSPSKLVHMEIKLPFVLLSSFRVVKMVTHRCLLFVLFCFLPFLFVNCPCLPASSYGGVQSVEAEMLRSHRPPSPANTEHQRFCLLSFKRYIA